LNAANVALAPLSGEETARLMWALGVETQPALVERAGGNPLYAEQYVRMLQERGSADELPESVRASSPRASTRCRRRRSRCCRTRP
jgi:hypothetical protein